MSESLRADVAPGYRLSRTQVEALRDAAYETSEPALGRRNDLIVTLLYDVGIRPGRLVAIDVDMVSEDRHEIALPEEVDAPGTVVELDPSGTLGTRRLLLAYLNQRPMDGRALFPSRKADRLTVRGLRYVVEQLAETAAVRPYASDGTRGAPADVTPQVIADSPPPGSGLVPAGAGGPRSDGEQRLELASGLPDGRRRSAGQANGAGRGERDDVGADEPFVETALDTVVDLFYVLDANGRFRRWNERVSEVTGYSERELDERHALDLVVPEDRERVAEAMTAVFEDGTVETREAHLLTRTGEGIPYEFNGAPVTDRHGEVRWLAGVGRDLTERKRRERTLERHRRTINAVGDGIYQMDADGQLVAVNDAVVEVTGYDRDALLGEHASKVVSPGDVEESVEVIRDLLASDRDIGTLEMTVETSEGESIPAQARMAVLEEDGEFHGTVGVVRDISERKERERELARQRDELETLARINEVIRAVDRTLVQARTRDAVEQAVCETLVDSEPYRFAWIGDYDAGGDRIEPGAWAGEGDGYLDERPGSESLAEDDVTAGTAYHADEVQIARNIAENPEFSAWRDAALERGYRSAIAVPLSYRDASHGVLCIYAPRPDAFDDRECAVLEELGETIAYALSAIERRRALVTDSVVELELRVRDPDVFLATLAKQSDRTLTLNGSTPAADGGLAAYLTVTDGTPDAVLESAATLDVTATVVEEHGDEGLLRFRPAPSIQTDLADHGGVVREMVADDSGVWTRVEFPQDVAIRTVVEALADRYETVDVLAHREGKRPATTGAEFRAELKEVFTDRQSEVLEAAYLSGFFEWPRDETGEEIADTLGIATTTFHEHVRKSQRKLFETYFEE